MKILLLALLALGLAAPAATQSWRTAWYASPQPVWDASFVLSNNLPPTLEGRTVVQRLRLNLGGSGARLVLSNRYGRQPVHIEAVTFGERHLPVRFGGSLALTLPPGVDVQSDIIAAPLDRSQLVQVAIRFAGEPPVQSFHWDGRNHARIFARSQPDESTTVRLFVSQLLVKRSRACGAFVALGDSITDGSGVAMDSDTRWTDLLARRSGDISIVNAGISGARLLTDGMGQDAAERFDNDVAAQPGARAVMILLGTNDIAWPGSPFAPQDEPMTLERMIVGYRNIAAIARTYGLSVVGATLPPFAGALPGTPMAGTYHTPAKEALRQQVNDWMRRDHPFDLLIDLDVVLRDPRKPSRLLPRYDSGDHLHPGNAGNAAIARAINLAAILPQPCEGEVK